MANSDKTPLWLDLRKEYIDDNFEKLRGYLCDCSTSAAKKDSFYDTTIKLLRARVEDLIASIANRPIYNEDDERKSTTFNATLLATYLLTDGDHNLALPAYVAFMGELRLLNPRFSEAIITAATERLRYEKVTAYGFNWKNLDKIGTELFAYNAAKLVKFDVPRKKPLVFTKFGTAYISADGLFLTHESATGAKKLFMSGANSLETGIGITLRSLSSEKLKQSYENQMPKVEEFIKDFIRQQDKVQNKESAPTAALKRYYDNDEAVVRVTRVDLKSGTIYVETTDPRYNKLSGPIVFEKASLVYYYTDTLYEFFCAGDYLKATISNAEQPTFNIEKQLIEFFVEDTKRAEEESDEFLALLIDERPKYFGWINEFGIAMHTQNAAGFSRGDFGILNGVTYGTGKYYGKIDAQVVKLSNEHFDEKTVRHDCIRAFAEDTPAPVYEETEVDTSELSPVIISLLMRQLLGYQRTLLKPTERFTVLANINVMAELVGDAVSSSYSRFARNYLMALVEFVAGNTVKDIQLTPDEDYKEATSTKVRMEVIDLLKQYGMKEDSKRLADAIQEYKDTMPMLSRLARLIQTANAMQDTLSGSALNVIKREIIKTLSIETENDADLEAASGTYLGIESGTQEFKTSIIFPSNNNMQPDEYAQNMNVLKGVCAFLNSTTGGVLYLGVNDQGYVTGVENDMKYLSQTSIDSYLRYIQDTAKKHFGIDTLPYLRIEPLYDNQVVAIHVDPHPYRVVELNNTAYLRVNAESREMPEGMRQQLIASKVFTKKNQAAAISLLQHACSQRKRVVLHNYASSNSGKVADRTVEAYDVRPEDGLAICYDCKKLECSVFKINRIGYVEILDSEPWSHTAVHKKIDVDVFHMSGTKPVAVSLQLDLMAKNLLIEEFPSAKDCIKPHKGDNNIWYFDTEVYQMEGIGRFYLGLANHIKILHAPELEQYVATFVKEFLSQAN